MFQLPKKGANTVLALLSYTGQSCINTKMYLPNMM